MTLAARKLWEHFVDEMEPTGVLRTVDADSLMSLCEDAAMLAEMRRGLRAQAAEFGKKAKAKGEKIPGGPVAWFSRTIEGRRTLATIRELESSVRQQKREFGLTPSSNTRVEGSEPSQRGGLIASAMTSRRPQPPASQAVQ